MAMRYNPPPNWPAPPAGWAPEPGWQPDPEWGPAPDGWQLWVDDDGASAKMQGRPRKRRLLWPILGGLAVLFIIIGVTGGGDDATTAGTEPSTSTSGEETAAESPAAVETPTPTPEPEPVDPLAHFAFPTVEVSGTGDDVVTFDKPAEQPSLMTATHDGGGNFVVFVLDDTNVETELLVNTIGSYSGTVVFDEAVGTSTSRLKVTADGPWTITVKSIAEASIIGEDGQGSATGDNAIWWMGDPAVAAFAHDGAGNFVVFGHGDSSQLLVNEIGAYDGTVPLPGGPVLLEVTADGSWTVAISE